MTRAHVAAAEDVTAHLGPHLGLNLASQHNELFLGRMERLKYRYLVESEHLQRHGLIICTTPSPFFNVCACPYHGSYMCGNVIGIRV